MESPPVHELTFDLPAWTRHWDGWRKLYASEEERVGLSVWLARRNIEEGTGGPFGAAVFEADTGKLVSIGMNLVVPQKCAVLHAEIVALMAASRRLGSHTLRSPGGPSYDLATSCEPCALCLGSLLWFGVSRVLCSATRRDAEHLGFDEGPVFPESYAYLEKRGIVFVRELLRSEGQAVLRDYGRSTGAIY
jgi:tRNA(Arg) A34 adenosine deaminase TadA